MDKKLRVIVTIDRADLDLWNALAAEYEKVSLFRERGYRPAVLSRLFYIFRASGVSADEFVRREYVLSPLIR